MINQLFEKDYEFIMKSKLQSDPFEWTFSQYRKMTGGRFLVALREVIKSERVLFCKALIKMNINFSEEGLTAAGPAKWISKWGGAWNTAKYCRPPWLAD